MAIRKFTRSTKGYNGPVFVASPINITTDATIEAFLANAPLGEVGVFDGVDALHTNLITSAEKFYFVQKTTEGIKRTPALNLSDVVSAKKLYNDPVKQVSAVGWGGTGGALNLGTVAARDIAEFAVIETTEGFEPFPTWNYLYQAKSGDAQIEVMLGLAKQINNPNSILYQNNEPLVTAKVKADATYGNFVMTGTTPTVIATNGSAVLTLGGGTPTHNAAVGDLISIDAAATPTDAVGNIYKVIAVVAAVSITLDRPYEGATQTFTEAEGEGTRHKVVTAVVQAGLELTAIDFDTHFRIAVREKMEDADITYITSFVKGNGTYSEVLKAEKEGQTWEGDTAKNSEFAADYGQQDTFSVLAETYDAYLFKYINRHAGHAPHDQAVHYGFVTVWVAKSAGNVDTSLDTLFGL